MPACNYPAELFCVVQGILHHSSRQLDSDHTKACCNQFAIYFSNKLAQIKTGLDAGVDACSDDVPLPPACPTYIDTFQLMEPEDVDKKLGEVRPTTYVLNPCPSWLIYRLPEGS